MTFKPEGHHHRVPDTHLLDNFYVVTMISNPVRFRSRYALYEQFAQHMKEAGVKLITIELCFGDRNHQITNANDPNHIQLQIWDELWHKENAINIAVSRLPANWEYVAWIDADVEFTRKDWAIETVHQLQHHHVVQLFQTAADHGPNHELIADYKGFAYCYLNGIPAPTYGSYGGGIYGTYWHPGYAWAMRREAWDHLGGLIDWAVLGAADYHMAKALIGQATSSVPPKLHPNYHMLLNKWEKNAEIFIKRDIGFVPGHLIHHWHGKKKDRRYRDRWKILATSNFDPINDIKRDWQGLWQLSPLKPKLRDDLRGYFRSRNEDSIDLD